MAWPAAWVVPQRPGRPVRDPHHQTAPYPDATIPARIHAAILEPGKQPYYLSDYVFGDDRFVTPPYLATVRGPGGKGVVTLRKTSAGWTGKSDIRLGEAGR